MAYKIDHAVKQIPASVFAQDHTGGLKILFYCQSSLGIGHTMRSLRLASGLGEISNLCFLNGGSRIGQLQYPTNINIVDLLPIKSDPEFSGLISDVEGIDLDQVFNNRREVITSAFKQLQPDIVIVELFPFGRGAFSAELKPLLKLAKNNGTHTICSLRDILVEKNNQDVYEQKVVKLMNEYFNVLLIHGDPSFHRLEECFSRLSEIKSKIFYTGYVTPKFSDATKLNSSKEIIASIGGGRFGHELAEAVVKSAPLLAKEIPHNISLYTGPFCPPDVADKLKAEADGMPNVLIQDFVENIHQKLQQAELSISMGGYNTTMDVLASGVPAMMMPCVNSGGMDQSTRLEKLAKLDVIDIIHPADLEPLQFSAKVISNLRRKRKSASIDLNGVPNTIKLISHLSEQLDVKEVFNG